MHSVVESKDIDAGVISTNIELQDSLAFLKYWNLSLFNFGYYDPPGQNCWPCQHLRLPPPHDHSHCLHPHPPHPHSPQKTLCLFCRWVSSQNPRKSYISFISLVLNVGTKSLMSSETYSWQVFTPCKNYLLGNPLHGCRVLNLLLGKLSLSIHRFVNTKLYFCSSTALVLNDVLNGLLESASNES